MQQAQKQPGSSVPAYRGFADDTTNLTASSGSAAAQSQQKRGIATPPMSFKECVFKVKDVYEKSTNMLDNMVKLNVIQQYLQQYFEDEDPADVFEGFARLVIHLDKFTSQLAKQHDLSLVKVALSCYHTFVQAHPELGEKPKMLEEPDIVIKALKILSELKVKHAPLIIEVFHLKNALMQAAAQDMIMAILLKEDYAKAVHWMALLNLRDNFPFDKIASQLILDNQRDTLDLFVGESEFRRKKMLRFLDEILECQWKNRSANDELKTRLILDSKRVGKLAVSLVKSYNMNDSEVPYVMLHRAYQALIYHHLGWEHGERSWNHFEELALPAIREHPEMRHKYFSFLFNKGLGDKALYFAQLINLPYGAYSAQLKYHCEQHPEACSSTREKIAQNTEIRLRNEEIEQQNECQLDSGEPIRLVDTVEALDELVDLLRHGDQKLIGIDAEWRPHFLSAYELVSIIQIATAKAVYIVDVYILDKEEKLAEQDWLKFFDALFCTEGLVKIGYDIANDIRVLRSTFPFITKTFANANSVICLYRLFRQIMVIPEAQTTVFGSHAPKDLGLALSDMVHHFLGVQLEKSERIGNWGLRPLRLEQLKYAAQDAHCLVQLYQKISPLILSIGDDTQIALQHAALMNLKVEEKQQLPHLLADGQQVRSAKEGEGDFASNVQKGAAELLSKVAGASSAPTKSVKDVRFVADSMLFGLGKNLRKCGIKTELIGERSKIIEFCQQDSNKDYIVLSTGKAYKQLEAMLGEDRLLYVPVSTHTGAVPPSMLVNHVMRELNIIIRPEDIYSRCMDCNKRGFVRFPMPVVRVLFYMNVIRLGAEWLDITQEDLQDAFIKLRGESALTVQITPGLHTGEEPRQNPELLPSDDAYYLYEDRSHLMCETRHCAMDLITKLLVPHNKDGPVAFHVGLKFKKSTFEEPDLQFFVCTGCGKMQYKSGNSGGIEE